MSSDVKQVSNHQGVVISYNLKNSRGLTEARQVRFISNQVACDWLTEQWPIICAGNKAWIINIHTDVPVHYPDYKTFFKDTPH